MSGGNTDRQRQVGMNIDDTTAGTGPEGLADLLAFWGTSDRILFEFRMLQMLDLLLHILLNAVDDLFQFRTW